MATASNGGTSTAASQPLFVRFPVNSSWEFTLSDQETVTGKVYCTDEATGIVVLEKALVHTTLASEIRVIQASEITLAKQLPPPDGNTAASSAPNHPLPRIQKKTLEDREKRALKLAEESLRHINQRASPEGQAVFDRLLKACAEVVWKDESIVVLHQIQVDPPYKAEHCHICDSAEGKNVADSLERVKKIVAAAAAVAANNNNKNTNATTSASP